MSVGVPYNGRNKKLLDFESATALDQGVEFFFKTVGLSPTTAATAVNILPDAQVGATRIPNIMGYAMHVNGATAWSGGTGTKVSLTDTLAASIIDFPASVLTANNVVETKVTGVVYSANMTALRQGTLGKGLQFKADNNFGAGSPIVFMVYGMLGS